MAADERVKKAVIPESFKQRKTSGKGFLPIITKAMIGLTTKATKEIAKKYGGLSNLGDKLVKSENYEDAIGEIVWLIVTLANQPILIFNYKNKGNEKPLLTEGRTFNNAAGHRKLQGCDH